MTQESIQRLHERASSSFQAGDYLEALAAWRLLLEADPADEQALEGARLCESLAVEALEKEAWSGSNAILGNDAYPRAVGQTSADPDAVFAELSDELLDDAPVSQASSFPPTMPMAETAKPSSQAFDLGFDFLDDETPAHTPSCDPGFDLLESNVESVAVPRTVAIEESLRDTLSELDAAVAVDSGPIPSWSDDEFDGTEELVEIRSDDPASEVRTIPGGDVEVPNSEAAAAAAAAGLRRRVNELLAEALAHLERGAREDALVVLDRVLILDETQETAATLRDRIRQELRQPTPAPAFDPDRAPAPFVSPPEVPRAKDAKPSETRLPAKRASVTGPPASARRTWWPPRFTLPGSFARVSPRLWLIAALGVGVVAVGIGAWIVFGGATGGGSEGSMATAAVAPTPTAGRPSKKSKGKAESEQGGEASSASAPPVAAPRAAQDALTRAEAAAAAEDWAGAVLAYDQALKLDPDNALIRERLLAVGQRFEAVRALKSQWTEARSAFENADYRTSLALLYRLPKAGTEAQIVEAHIVAGWFNMGLVALREGACREAIEALGEAAALRPSDSAIQAAHRLARSCAAERATTSYQIAVGALSPLPIPEAPSEVFGKS